VTLYEELAALTGSCFDEMTEDDIQGDVLVYDDTGCKNGELAFVTLGPELTCSTSQGMLQHVVCHCGESIRLGARPWLTCSNKRATRSRVCTVARRGAGKADPAARARQGGRGFDVLVARLVSATAGFVCDAD
jgi:hypothetical protein